MKKLYLVTNSDFPGIVDVLLKAVIAADSPEEAVRMVEDRWSEFSDFKLESVIEISNTSIYENSKIVCRDFLNG